MNSTTVSLQMSPGGAAPPQGARPPEQPADSPERTAAQEAQVHQATEWLHLATAAEGLLSVLEVPGAWRQPQLGCAGGGGDPGLEGQGGGGEGHGGTSGGPPPVHPQALECWSGTASTYVQVPNSNFTIGISQDGGGGGRAGSNVVTRRVCQPSDGLVRCESYAVSRTTFRTGP